MSVYTIGDLHLSLGDPAKTMEVFRGWQGYQQRLEENWRAIVRPEDTVVLAGDISWAMHLAATGPDFRFLDRLPGRKLLMKGNHDYWWSTVAKMKKFFAENGLTTIDILHNNCFFYGEYALCGTRGWFYEEETSGHNEKILNREVGRLEASLRAAGDRPILAFLHYPPLYTGYRCPEILRKLEEYKVERCFYGHLHGPSHKRAIEGQLGGVTYSLVAADYLGFVPKKILEF